MNINLRVSVAFLTVSLAAMCLGQQVPPDAKNPSRTIKDVSDLEFGMPQESVLANLRTTYRLEHETPASGKDDDADAWAVWLEARFVGELFFGHGKLRLATKRIWSPGDGDPTLIERLFTSVFDNSEQSSIEEQPGGQLSRTRDIPATLESSEMSIGKFKMRTLKMIFHGKQFNLSVTTSDGDEQIALDEVVAQDRSVPQMHSAKNQSGQ